MQVRVLLEIDPEELESNGTSEMGEEIADLIEYNTGFTVDNITIVDEDTYISEDDGDGDDEDE